MLYYVEMQNAEIFVVSDLPFEPECRTDYCEQCGDCLDCCGGDPCVGRYGKHIWCVSWDDARWGDEDVESWVKFHPKE